MINKLEKANTEEVTTLFSSKHGFTCAMRYIARKDIKEYYIEIFKMAQEAINLAPAAQQARLKSEINKIKILGLYS